MKKTFLAFVLCVCLALSHCAVNFETYPIDSVYANALLNAYRKSKISNVKIEQRDKIKYTYKLSSKAIQYITNTVNDIQKKLPNVSNIPFTQDNERITIIGDLHGQFSTLLHIVTEGPQGDLAIGSDSNGMRRRYIFVGDYINREYDSLPIVILAYAMKCAFPDDVFLIRGNHETTGNTAYKRINLSLEVDLRYPMESKTVLGYITNSFKYLPIGYVIDRSIIVVHAGVGPNGSKNTIEKLNSITRTVENPGGLFHSAFNSRGFDSDYIKQFLDAENLQCLVRGHDSNSLGIEDMIYKYGNTERSICITVHSASFCCPCKNKIWSNRNAGGFIHFFNRGDHIGRYDRFLGDVVSDIPDALGKNNPSFIKSKNDKWKEIQIRKSDPSKSSVSQLNDYTTPISHQQSWKSSLTGVKSHNEDTNNSTGIIVVVSIALAILVAGSAFLAYRKFRPSSERSKLEKEFI